MNKVNRNKITDGVFYFKKMKMDELELIEVTCILIESDYKYINSLNNLVKT